MKICLFGTYHQNYSRNQTIRDGLIELGVDTIEIHREVAKLPLETSQDLDTSKIVKRIWRKLITTFSLLKDVPKIAICDVVVVLFPGHLDLPIAGLLTKILRKKLVFDSSMSLYDTLIVDRQMADRKSFKVWALKRVEKVLLTIPNQILVDTPQMRLFITREFGVSKKKIAVVPLGASDQVYKPAYNINRQKNKIRVFFFGLYNPLQGTRWITRAAKILKNDDDIKIVMLGEGPLKGEAVEYVRENRLENVEFIGFVPESKLVSEINRADICLGIFANTSISRRVIPNKVMAALACAKPLITARLNAAEEVLIDKNSVFYCEPENEKSLARAIRELAHDAKLRKHIAEGGYQVYLKSFTPREVAKSLVNQIGVNHA